MPEQYVDTPADYKLKYGGCFCLYNKKPHLSFAFSFGAGDVIYAEINDIMTMRPLTVPVANVDFTVPTLGFTNLLRSSVWIGRTVNVGNDKYKRGLFLGQLCVLDISQYEKNHLGLRTVNNISSRIISSVFNKELESMEGAYKAVSCYKALSTAFHKNYAFALLAHGIALFYKQHLVGVMESPTIVKLHPYFFNLKEEIESFGLQVEFKDV